MSELAKGCLVYFDFSQFPSAINIARLLGRSAGNITYGSGLASKPNVLKRRVIVTNTGSTNYKASFTSPLGPSSFATNHTIYCRYSITSSWENYIAGILNYFQLIHNYVDGQVEMYTAGSNTGANVRTSSGMNFAYDGKEHAVCYTYDGAAQKGYIDGLKLVENTKTYALNSTATSGIINGSGVSANMFAGTVQCFGMWNRALTQAEIKEIDRNPSWYKPSPVLPIARFMHSAQSFKAWLHYHRQIRS